MTVKTGSAWAGLFVTLDATGAASAADSAPTGTLYVDGVSNAASVTITGSNPYKFAVTLPTLTAGQRVDMYITATIDTIATAGIVASDQADTALVSDVKAETALILADTGTDGVVVASGQTVATVTNLTNLPTMPADWVTASGLKADAVAEIADGVWDEAISGHTTATTFGGKNQKVVPSETVGDYKADVSALTNVTLAATQTGVTIPTVTTITNGVTLADDAITSAKFDESTAYPLKSADTGATQVARVGADSDTLETLSDQLDVVQTDLDNPAQYKADVSGLALEATLTAIKGAGWTTETLVTLKAYVDEIETRLTAVRAGYLDKLNVTGTLAHSDAAATYKADVSGLAPANEYDARMTALQADLDNPDQYKADVSGLATSAEVGAIDTDTIMSFMIDGFTFEQIVQIMASVLAGKLTRSGDTLTFRDLADTVNRVVVETDENKQRTGMTYTV